MVSLTDPAGVNAAMGEWLNRPACISGERT
jgi:hypothetical protein